MQVIYIKNYKKKLLIIFLLMLLWMAVFKLSEFLIRSSLILDVSIDDYISFSHPISLSIENIYASEKVNAVVETNFAFVKPVTEKFSSYSSLKGKFSFKYPSAFELSEQEFSESDILYHIDLYDKSSKAHGFVQVWNIPHPLKEFLEDSITASQQDFEYFKSNPVTVNNLQGYHWDYVVVTGKGEHIRGSEVFLKKDDLMYRISYFIPEEKWNDNQYKTFWGIVKSLKAE